MTQDAPKQPAKRGKKQTPVPPPTIPTPDTSTASATPAANGSADTQSQNAPAPAKRGRKPKAAAVDASQADSQAQSDSQPQKAAPKRGKKRAAAAEPEEAEPEEEEPSQKKAKPSDSMTPELENAQVAKPGIKVPVDEFAPLPNYEVYIDDNGVIYDASLNQTNAGANNNKFYRIQLLCNVTGDYKTWTRWGRVGDTGQSAVLGDGAVADALRNFNKKFKDKSGLAWEDRCAPAKPKKYTFVERSYAPDSDDEDDSAADKKVKSEGAKDEPEPDSKLAKPIQELMELIFNQQYFQNVMTSLNYDANKLPLGKLSKTTITRGFQALKDLSALIMDRTLAGTVYNTSFEAATEQLSNSYFSLIPHAFGRNRPPIIRDSVLLKKEIELLESLGDMKEAAALLKGSHKDAEKMNQLDRQFRGLGMEEMTPLDHSGTEFQELKDYLMESRGATHNFNYQVDQIFRIERQGEKDRFENSPFSGPPKDRRLLWHGSRCTNFGGILSQGLRIAPPEAPATGYMFGKGIYLADMSSKSAGYCCAYNTNGHALLLLCEAELGDPMQKLVHASYNAGDTAKAGGMHSTWGQGRTGPSQWKDAGSVHPSLQGVKIPDVTVKPSDTGVPGAGLYYNEYIAYDVAQIRLRYLFRVRM
jgi:poly [ADP-ribose] polymerase 2/3/4